MRDVWFHEDDAGQIEFLPVSNLRYCKKEMGIIDAHADEHRVEGGGWSQVYLRSDAPESLATLGITFSELSDALGMNLEPYERVFIGFGTNRELCSRTFAWGDERFDLFAEVNETKVIKYLWFGLGKWSFDKQQHYCEILFGLPHATELLIADWPASRVVRLADSEDVRAYVAEWSTML